MKVFVDPIPSHLSMAMHRVAAALKRYAPEDVKIVPKASDSDLQFLHVIAPDSLGGLKAPRYAIIQYCLNSAPGVNTTWQKPWEEAELVWSYYDLVSHMARPTEVNFFLSPLGIDEPFVKVKQTFKSKDIGVMTSGYVSGPGAEAIEEVAIASSLAGMTTMHLGPHPQGMGIPPTGWSSVQGISDDRLANLYYRSYWVSGLRHIEGFELPVIEGLSCGARPIVFDRPEMRRWYRDHAVFVPECHGSDLIGRLLEIFQLPPEPVLLDEQLDAREKFSWANIIPQVWAKVLTAKTASV